MKGTNLFKSQCFLMELIISIMFFALCSVICISAFAKAEIISRDGYELNRGFIMAQSAAECIKASSRESLSSNMYRFLALKENDDGGYYSYYDKKFNPVGEGNEEYCLRVDISTIDDMMESRIVFEKVETESRFKEICILEIKKYLPDGQESKDIG